MSAMVLTWLCKMVCKDTPVLMVNNTNQFSFKNTGRAMAMAATMPIVAVPIQEVQLLDYAVAHEIVNSTSLIDNDLTASVDDDIYLGLMDSQAERSRSQDPYTSDQQRERDEYKINDTDWNEVVFEEVNGSSTAKLALHNDWINKKGYQVDAIVEMNLPEQGISGPFKITSIKHIIPQKKPVDDDEADDYGYKPVAALFTHESNQVYDIDFDNGESLGVTYQHPIYSVTAGDWKLAGELEIGEQVLTKEGEATVTSSEKKRGSETVYNLEVKELHNFLVGESGILVHNSCHKSSRDWFKEKKIPAGDKTHPVPGTKKNLDVHDKQKIKEKHPDAVDADGNLKVCYDDLGFPDFRSFVPKLMGKNGQLFDGIVEIPQMLGKNSKDFKAALDILKTQLPSTSPIQAITAGKVPFDIDGVKYTFHHHQDGKSMMLVPSSVNNPAAGGASHIGGGSIMKKTDESPFKDFGPKSDKNIFTKCK